MNKMRVFRYIPEDLLWKSRMHKKYHLIIRNANRMFHYPVEDRSWFHHGRVEEFDGLKFLSGSLISQIDSL